MGTLSTRLPARGALTLEHPMSETTTASAASRSTRRSLSVRGRLFSLVAVLCALWLVSVGVATFGLSQARQQIDALATTFAASDQAHLAYESWLADDSASNMYVGLASLDDPSQATLTEDTWKVVTTEYADAAKNLTALQGSTVDGIAPLATAAVADLAGYNAFTEKVRTQVQAGNVAAALKIMTVDNFEASQKLDASLNAINDQLASVVSTVQSDANAAVTRWTTILLVLVAIGLVLAIVIVLKVISSITSPLKDIEAALGSLAEGDLKVRALVKTNDELGRVAQSLNTAAAAQQASVSAIGDNAQMLAAAAEELTATSGLMSEAAGQTTDQAVTVAEQSEAVTESVQAASTAAEELTASIGAISANAWEAARVASTAVEVAGLTSAIMAKLGQSSADIGTVIKEIRGVAEQTNLLALNATIESARAGEAGKGFAVVASEVKDLARATASATTDITAKIQAISDDTLEAIGAIEQISGTINEINEIQHSIASAVEQQTAAVNEIARSMSMAADGSGRITISMDGVNTSAQSASSGAAQTGQAANELAQMASSLETLVASFRY